MIKIFTIFIFASSLLFSKTLSATYDVSYGIFSNLGKSKAHLHIDENSNYIVRIDASAEGFAKILSNSRVELYESYGKVVDDRLIPDVFIKTRATKSKTETKRYEFNHTKKIVSIERSKNGIKQPKEKYDFYAPDDILSLFFNSKLHTKEAQNYTAYAIGGNNKDGKIDIEFPKGTELEKIKKSLGTARGDFLKVILNQPIFSSSRGELIINLNRDGLAEIAILEDVLLFGDILGKKR